jgi:phospholipid/cholesterol/gamma-HCH transport system permease protein
MNLFQQVGKYSLLMYQTFSVPQRWGMFFKQTWKEIEKLGADSLPITLIISLFMGAVMTMQIQLDWLPAIHYCWNFVQAYFV